VDFSYEVSRSIASCEGALLIVDCTQGIQAQTISNLYLAMEHDLTIIPVLNKIDLPNAEPELVKDQVVELLGCERDEILIASGKTLMIKTVQANRKNLQWNAHDGGGLYSLCTCVRKFEFRSVVDGYVSVGKPGRSFA
jgi:translation elongation factor EF-G